MQKVDLRTILPGLPVTVQGEFACPSDFPEGDYILALAILDPAGNQPAVRFASRQYFRGGRHPIGWLGVGRKAFTKKLPHFDDPATDALSYAASAG